VAVADVDHGFYRDRNVRADISMVERSAPRIAPEDLSVRDRGPPGGRPAKLDRGRATIELTTGLRDAAWAV